MCYVCRFRERGFRIVNFNASVVVSAYYSGARGAMEKAALPHISCLSFICVGAVAVRVIIMQVVCSNIQHVVTTLIESTLFGLDV